jgi:hypothetical protein
MRLQITELKSISFKGVNNEKILSFIYSLKFKPLVKKKL